MFSGEHASHALHDPQDPLGDRAHLADPSNRSQVEERAHVETSPRGVGIPLTRRPVLGQETIDAAHILPKLLHRDGDIFDE
jgi:hypothetical protein